MVFGRLVFRLDPGLHERHPSRRWRQSLVIGWAGMRGAVSLAAALAVPSRLANGAPFPGRDLIVFLTTTVIFVTVVLQGLSLPALIRALRIAEDGDEHGAQVRHARRLGAQAALKRVEQLRQEEWLPEDVAELLRDLYTHRAYALTQTPEQDSETFDYEARYDALLRLRRELIDVERNELLRLSRSGDISHDAMRRVERDLDLEASRFNH